MKETKKEFLGGTPMTLIPGDSDKKWSKVGKEWRLNSIDPQSTWR